MIPPYADVICDCRSLPAEREAEVRAHVDRALGDGFADQVEFLELLAGGTESGIDTPLYRACEEYVAERLPGAVLLPLIGAGFSNSYWVRKAWGSAADGFAPVFATAPDVYLDGAHGADEAARGCRPGRDDAVRPPRDRRARTSGRLGVVEAR